MKIALLTPTFSAFSGIDRVVELQAQELVKKGNEVTIFTLKGNIKIKNVNIVSMGMQKSSFFERLYRLLLFLNFSKIKKYGKRLKNYDLIVSHFYPMNLFAMYAKKHYKIKYVYHNHGIAYPELFKGFFERNYMRLFRMFTNWTVKKADSAVSISKFLRDELKKETGLDSKIEYDPIDRKRFHKGIKGNKIRNKFGIGKDPICLYIGRISPHKGVDLLIKSFNLVLKEFHNAKLIIVGKETFDDYAKELKRLSKKINPKSIIFAGFVPDEELAFYYAACDVYTTATLWEGFDLPAAEAQACGKPVVAFDIGAHPEVVKKGNLVKAGDFVAFAEETIKCLERK